MPLPHYRPISYLKTPILWAFYYLKHDYNFNDAIKHILSKGGDTAANAAIVGGLIGAARGINGIDRQLVNTVLTVHQQQIDLETGESTRPTKYQPGSVISTNNKNPLSKIHAIIAKAPKELVVKWGTNKIKGKDLNTKISEVLG